MFDDGWIMKSQPACLAELGNGTQGRIFVPTSLGYMREHGHAPWAIDPEMQKRRVGTKREPELLAAIVKGPGRWAAKEEASPIGHIRVLGRCLAHLSH